MFRGAAAIPNADLPWSAAAISAKLFRVSFEARESKEKERSRIGAREEEGEPKKSTREKKGETGRREI